MGAEDDMAAKRQALGQAWQAAAQSEVSLQVQLDRYVAASRAIIPDVLATYDRMVARLERGGAGAEAPAVGDALPDMLLPDAGGRLVAISSLHAGRPLVISFNRGHWCPYCRLELLALQKAGAALEASGVGLVSIVPETGEFSSRMIESNGLTFPVLSDIDHAYALQLALAVWTGDELRALYGRMGIDLARYQASASGLLPIPATLIIGADGCVRARFIDPEFRRRMSVEDILAALNGAGSSRR